jgi:thymidylate synthase (FAD)
LAADFGQFSESYLKTVNNYLNVLDHGYLRLVDSLGSDLVVARSARVSYDASWRAGEDEASDAKLIRYLWRNKHTTPFESVVFQFEAVAPIFVVRQWVRHRCATWNELSARYRELPETFYVPDPSVIGTQSVKNKQGRTLDGTDRTADLESYREHCKAAFALYRDLLAKGWPRELARCALPLSVYTHFFWKIDLLNLFKFITLRSDAHAQYEIRQYSDAMLTLIKPIVPVCTEVFLSASGGQNT